MAFPVPKATAPPKIETQENSDWLSGIVSANADGRTPITGLTSSNDVYLTQDGVVQPRPSLRLFGPQPLGKVLGEVFEFRHRVGSVKTNFNICIQVVDGVANAYIAKDSDSTWAKCTGKDFNTSASAHFLQIQDKVLIMNGEDSLCYLEIGTTVITTYTALATPSAPTFVSQTGLSGSAFKVYYAITANSTVGETIGSAYLTQSVLTDRDMWNPATQNVKIQWTAVPNAKTYNVYVAQTKPTGEEPTLYMIAGGLDPSIFEFTDNGSRHQDLNKPLPIYDSTAGPRVTGGTVINGRIWLYGDRDNPYYVRFGGDPKYELDFSPAHNGGYNIIGNGTKEYPVKVQAFHQGKGDPGVFVLSQGTNGNGKRYILSPTSIEYGSSVISFWEVTEDNGQDGTDSPDGVVRYNDALWYPSRDGFKTTGTKPQLQNVLSTDRVSNTIAPDISRLNNNVMHKCVGLAYEGRIYWALPVGNTRNNEIWVLDLDRKGAWMKSWNIAADWMWLYSDSNGITHFLILQNDKIYELTNKQYTNDNGVAFSTSGSSGVISFSEDGQQWVKLLKVIFTILQPQGALDFSVAVKTEDGVMTFSEGERFAVDSTVAGWGEPTARGFVGWGKHAWSEVGAVPESLGVATEDFEVEVDEEVQWYRYAWSSSGVGANYALSKVTPVYVPVGLKNLS